MAKCAMKIKINCVDFVYNPIKRILHAAMLTRLPSGLLAIHIMDAQLSPSERWRLRCASKGIGRIYAKWVSSQEIEIEIHYNLMMAVTFRNWRPILTDDTPFSHQVAHLLQERIPYGYTDAFFRWVKTNNVRIDAGGFYTPLNQGNQRVRIGLWETGVRLVETSRMVVLPATGFRGRVTKQSRFALPGFTVYTA